jgi:hypothetical protein
MFNMSIQSAIAAEYADKTVQDAIHEALRLFDEGNTTVQDAIKSIYKYCEQKGLFSE